jgi:HK97 family phage prohead protease
MRFYWPIAKFDAERRMVWGYASTEAADNQGESVKREALAAALDDYMRFANIREMHQPSAVGIAEEAAIDDKGLYIAARIVDAEAWEKVAAGVYKGFSIGGKVTARDPADRTVITGLELSEISVVDRPANPEAVFDCWKRAIADGPSVTRGGADPASDPRATELLLKASLAPLADALAKLAGDLLPRLDALQQRVEAIAKTPLPPQTIARGLAGISKREDAGAPPATADDVVAALARMSDDERTLTLIKAAHGNPITPLGRPR